MTNLDPANEPTPAELREGRLTQVAILGLGEAGSAIARDIVAAGVAVAGWDPVPREVSGVEIAADAGSAVQGAQVILSVNSAKVALAVARGVRPHLRKTQVFADLNTGSAGLKRSLSDEIAGSGAAFVDVALMAPVPGRGLATPALVSGNGAARFVELMRPLGMPVEDAGEEPGSAATKKLLRSVFVKGVHGAFLEGYAAAKKLGWEEWYLRETSNALVAMDERAVPRIINGTRLHAPRRAEEMRAAAQMLTELGVEPRVTSATATVLDEIAAAGGEKGTA